MKFQKKLPIVDAVQWNPGIEIENVEEFQYDHPKDHPKLQHAYLHTRYGNFLVAPGDWILTDDEGKQWVVGNTIFKREYEPLIDGTPEARHDISEIGNRMPALSATKQAQEIKKIWSYLIYQGTKQIAFKNAVEASIDPKIANKIKEKYYLNLKRLE